MRFETLDMRFLLTVGFSLRTEATQTHPVSGGKPTIPSPQAEKVAEGGASTLHNAGTNCHLMTEEVFFHPPAPTSGREGLSVIPSLRSKRGISNNTRMLPPLPSLRQLQTLFRWLKPTAITPLNIEP